MRIGNYKVIKQISEGSFGRTFLGTHMVNGKKVCLKQDKTGDPVFQDLFRQEADLLWDLHHVSLPTAKDRIEDPNFGPVVVMSFIEGEDLQTIVERGGAIDPEHVCWILQRILDALSYLHYHKVIHCDIKPQNIILDIPVHNAVLVDFGLYVKNPDQMSKAKGGTQFFMPPEFLQGLPPLPASDLYSLGMTAVHLLGGNVQTGTIPRHVPAPLRSLIERMIRRDPLARPQDARTLNYELAQLRKAVFGRSSTQEAFKHA